MSEDKSQLVDGETRVYKRRWWILALFSFLALFQCTVWNTWGPVVNSMPKLYPSWSAGTVSLLANWGCIAFLIFMVPVLYLQDYSLRISILFSSSLIALGTSMRCAFLVFPDLSENQFTILAHIAAVLNGIPSIVVTSAPPAVSAAWFPPNERVTATSISQMLNNIGQGISFLLASLIVKEPVTATSSSNSSSDSLTAFNSFNKSYTHTHTLSDSLTSSNLTWPGHNGKAELKEDIHTYMLVLAGPALLLFILSLIYFPSKPPKPPSRSSKEARLDFLTGAKQLLSNPNSWLIAIVWSIPQAIWNNWCAMSVVSLTKICPHDECLTEKWVNYLGLVSVLVGTAVAILVGMVTDRIKGRMKITIITLLLSGGLMFTLLSLISLQFIKFPSMLSLKVSVYILLLLGNSCVVSTSPLLFEFGVEKFYPINEGMIGGWLNIWYNIISVIFLGIFNIPDIGSQWLSYVLPLSCFIVVPLFLVVKEEYKRRNVDEDGQSSFLDEETSDLEDDINYNGEISTNREPVYFD